MSTQDKFIVIEETFFKGSQSVEFKGIYKLNDFKIKIQIDRDSYDKQSSGTAHVWKDLKWNFIDSIHYTQLNVVIQDVSRFTDINNDPFTKTKFRIDINALKTKVKNILL